MAIRGAQRVGQTLESAQSVSPASGHLLTQESNWLRFEWVDSVQDTNPLLESGRLMAKHEEVWLRGGTRRLSLFAEVEQMVEIGFAKVVEAKPPRLRSPKAIEPLEPIPVTP